MIAFTLFFGEAYTNFFFDITLPAALSSGNIPAVIDNGEKTSLAIVTTKDTAKYVHNRIRELKLYGHPFSSIDVIVLPDKKPQDYKSNLDFKKSTLIDLLMTAIFHIYGKDEIFLYLVSDAILSNGTAENCYMLHRASGKTVSIFNGRIEADKEQLSFLDDVREQKSELKWEFLKRRDSLWRAWTVQETETIPEAPEGHLILEGKNFIHIFCRNPNPILGKFTIQDVSFFTDFGYFSDWDGTWRDRLAEQGRLIVQTNLDAGMSVEPIPPRGISETVTLRKNSLVLRSSRREVTKIMLERMNISNNHYKNEQKSSQYNSLMSMFCFTIKL